MLRDAAALVTPGIDLADAMVPWKPAVEVGEEPSSWAVRRRREEAGAHGLIDPSRTAPGCGTSPCSAGTRAERPG